MVIIPRYLKKGDKIGLVCPAGFMPLEKTRACIEKLTDDGYEVIVGKTVGGNSENYFSGSDAGRLKDFQVMLDDDSIAAILCARGGYGTTRIIDSLDFSRFKARPKWVIGFSDITVLHAHLYTVYNISSLHAPMAAAFNDGESQNQYIRSLLKALTGKKIKYAVDTHVFNRRGEAAGELVGGNLTMVAHLLGSVSEYRMKGKILFLEDVGEYLYNIDRMLLQMKRAGKLSKLAGVIIGGFSDLKDTERPYGKTSYEIIEEIFRGYDYPVCYNFPVSHERENYALKVGIGYKLKVGKQKVTLEE